MVPTDRTSFKEYCLRRLGKGAINIEVTDEQADDTIDYALKVYMDYHYDGTMQQYYKYLMSETDISNGYVDIPDNIIGVVGIFDIGASFGSDNMFSATYQFALSDIWNITSTSLVPYYMAMERIQYIQQLFTGRQPIRYNRHVNRCYIDMDLHRISSGTYLIFNCYQVIDPETYPDVWGDRWLINYTTQLLKRQWGENLKKYQGMKLPDGMMYNGQQIYDEAFAEVLRLEERLKADIMGPDEFFLA